MMLNQRKQMDIQNEETYVVGQAPINKRKRNARYYYKRRVLERTKRRMCTGRKNFDNRINKQSLTDPRPVTSEVMTRDVVLFSPIVSSTSSMTSVFNAGVVNHSMLQVSVLEKPKYPYKDKHPVDFIEDLTAYLKRRPKGMEGEIDTVLGCLEGEVHDWAQLVRNRWKQYEDFKHDFIQIHWGESAQRDLRRKLVHNTWESTSSTMAGHFTSLYCQAKMLIPPIKEGLMINDIMSHYPKDVQYLWLTNRPATIVEVIQFLQKLDFIHTTLKTQSDG